MPKTETLDERAARVAGESAEIARERRALATEQARRLAEHQEAIDAALIASWRPRDLDADVDQSRRDLERAVTEWPVTVALAAYLLSQSRRSFAWGEHLGALGRTGRSVTGAQLPPSAVEPSIVELVARAAQRLSEAAMTDERETFHAHRQTPEETT